MTRRATALLLIFILLLGALPLSAWAAERDEEVVVPMAPATENADPARIWSYFYEKLGNPCGVAGLMGNLQAESGLLSTNLQNTYNRSLGYSDGAYTAAVDDGSYDGFVQDDAGYGLAQWTFSTRKQNLLSYARSVNASIGNLDMQLDFLWRELQGYSGLIDALRTAATVRAASDQVLTRYERPADQSSSVKAYRASLGQNYFNTYATEITSWLYASGNYSGKNFLYASDFEGEPDPKWWWSRDESVATLSVDTEETHDGYHSLRIENSAPGASGQDLCFGTFAMGSAQQDGFQTDRRSMTLSFWARSDREGTTMYFRWGYGGEYVPVTLSTQWQFYAVPMDRTEDCGCNLYPYAGAAGTVWLAELQLEDGTVATDFAPEKGPVYDGVLEHFSTAFVLPETPVREGYRFDGWFTAPAGGWEITDSTRASTGHLRAYAHWSVDDSVHLARSQSYVPGQFADVAEDAWYADAVAAAYELGLMKGDGAGAFLPEGNVTLAEAMTIAARIHSIYTTGGEWFDQDPAVWYQAYLAYAYENGIVSLQLHDEDLAREATRAEFAEIFAAALPETGLTAINTVASNGIPDVRSTDDGAEAIYRLYRAGVLTGGGDGSFRPEAAISRAEAAAIVARMAESDARVRLTLR